MRIEWTVPAETCLQEILQFVAAENPDAAYRLVDGIVESTEAVLAEHPNAGRPGRADGTREWVAHKNYVVAYRVHEGRVQVLAVVHSARLWPTEF